MIHELKNTNAAKISQTLVTSRRALGSPATGMVLSLIVVTDESGYQETLEACMEAGREHPSRILLFVRGSQVAEGLDAEIHIGEDVPGEVVILRMDAEASDHADSVALPLLLPDSPVVVWWPQESPTDPAADPLGVLGDRRITDAMGAGDPVAALRIRAEHHSPGDTDLTWTRLTPWRALLAAALDQYPAEVVSVEVAGAEDNAPSDLLAAWLETRLNLDVQRTSSEGPGITRVRMMTADGDLSLAREDGLTASYAVPGQPQRLVALRRRDINQLITEELRRMDADDIFEQATAMLLDRAQRTTGAAP